jgi:hypothetical protein
MKQNVNYIEHHKAVNIKLSEDNLRSHHISLYNALFLIWNECGFDTELSINRNDVMKLSKIGSANTYTSALKELHEKGYINYKPSFNPLVGSKINLYRFDKGCDKGTDKGSVKSSSKGTGKGSDTLYKQLNNETTKQLNNEVGLSAAPPEKINYESFINFFNGTCTNFPNVKKITENRKKAISVILKKFTKQEIAEALRLANKSDFLNGDNQRGWKADFDFIIKENSITKILEGSYEKTKRNNTKGATGDELKEIIAAHFRD